MGKLILWMQSSLDGFTCGPKGEFDWPVVKPDLTAFFMSELSGAAVFAYGRTVYEGMAAFWPTADEGAEPDSEDYLVQYSRLWKAMPKVVISRSLTSADWDTDVFSDIEQVRAVKERVDGDIYYFGGSEVGGQLIAAGLMDEFQTFVHPVVLGGGAPLFPVADERLPVRLIESRTFGQVVSLRYASA